MAPKHKRAGSPRTPKARAESTADLVNVATRLPRDLVKELKLISVTAERYMRDIIEEALRDWVKKHKGSKAG